MSARLALTLISLLLLALPALGQVPTEEQRMAAELRSARRSVQVLRTELKRLRTEHVSSVSELQQRLDAAGTAAAEEGRRRAKETEQLRWGLWAASGVAVIALLLALRSGRRDGEPREIRERRERIAVLWTQERGEPALPAAGRLPTDG
jgi:hypothetical protein